MAGYRQFHTQFWKDGWLLDLAPLERYLFSYLFTNELSSISGLYKLPFQVIVNETGLDRSFVETSLNKFQEAKKIFYRDGVMWVVNMKKYHKNASPKTMLKVERDVAEIEDCEVKRAYQYYEKTGEYHIDTVSIPNSESVILSRSVSLSVSRSVSDTASPAAGSQPAYIPPCPEERIYCAVTNHPTIPSGEIDSTIDRIAKIQRAKNLDENGVVEYLRPFWKEAHKRYPATTKTFWIDWAVVGEIPKATGTSPNGKKGSYQPKFDAQAAREMGWTEEKIAKKLAEIAQGKPI